MVTIRTPYVPTSEIDIKFETYRFYLESFCRQIDIEYRTWENFLEKCLDQSKRLQGFHGFDEAWVKRWMKIAWNTEYLMEESIDDYELVRFNNQWKPIQSYYSVYAACEAAAYVLDGTYADGHHKSLKKVTDYLVKTSLSPWNKAFGGPKGRNANAHYPVNFPPNMTIPHNLQRSNINPIEMIAKCLKVEHKHRIDDSFVKRKGVWKYSFDPGYTGIMHFLYRLRVKSNYKDVEIFVSEAPEENIKGFSDSLEKIVVFTLTILELILLRRCKKSFVLGLANEYITMNKKAEELKKRVSFYGSSI